MRNSPQAVAAGLLLLSACASPSRPQAAPGAQGVGVPDRVVDPSVATAPMDEKKDSSPIELPDRIVIPAAYRLMLVDGRLTLVRETDPKTMYLEPSSLRIVSGETTGGDLSYQPALLPQELAAEVAANKESSARMDNALDTVMQRSRELSTQAADLQDQAKRLGDLLALAQAHEVATKAPNLPAVVAPDPTATDK